MNTHEFSEHARRGKVQLKDIITACEELGVGGSAELIEELSSKMPLEDQGHSNSLLHPIADSTD